MLVHACNPKTEGSGVQDCQLCTESFRGQSELHGQPRPLKRMERNSPKLHFQFIYSKGPALNSRGKTVYILISRQLAERLLRQKYFKVTKFFSGAKSQDYIEYKARSELQLNVYLEMNIRNAVVELVQLPCARLFQANHLTNPSDQ